MSTKYTRAAALLCALGALSLAGCVADEEGGSGGSGSFSVETEMKVLEIMEPTATTAGTIETRSYDYGCEGDEVVKDSSDELQSYVVTGGHLYMWDEEEGCEALKLSGSSSTIIGKWSMTGLMADAEIPTAYRQGICDSVSEEDYEEYEDDVFFDSVFQDIKISYDISQSRVKGGMSGRICMGTLLGSSYGIGSGGFIEVVSSDCATATVKNTLNDKTLKISTQFSNEVLKVTFTSSGKSCSYSEALDLSSKAPTCPEPDYDAEEEAFDACLETLAFYQGMGGDDELTKRSSSRVSDLVKKVRKASPGL